MPFLGSFGVNIVRFSSHITGILVATASSFLNLLLDYYLLIDLIWSVDDTYFYGIIVN